LDILLMAAGPAGPGSPAPGLVAGPPPATPGDVLAAAQTNGLAAASLPVTGGAANETVRVQVRPWQRPELGLSGYVVAGQTSRKVGQDRAGRFVLFLVSSISPF